jgi:hypothetical protein
MRQSENDANKHPQINVAHVVLVNGDGQEGERIKQQNLYQRNVKPIEEKGVSRKSWTTFYTQ